MTASSARFGQWSSSVNLNRARARRGRIEVIVPEPEDRAEVHRIIYEELCQGQVLDRSRDTYRGVIDRLVGEGAEGVILGCTEIELLVDQAHSAVPVYPTTRILVEAAVTQALDLRQG
jgi:aspartate racemase